TAKFFKLHTNMDLKNFNIISNKEKDSLLLIRNHNDLLLENISVKNPRRNGIYIQYGGRDTVVNCYFERHGFVEKDQGYASKPTDPEGLSFGYGLIHARNAFSVVNNCKGRYGWHSFDA